MSLAEIGRDPHHERLDLGLVQKAIRDEWPIPDDVRKRAIERCKMIIDNPESKYRAVLSATRTLASLYKLNLAATQLLSDNKPQVVVVNNNTNNVDTLSQVASGFTNPEDSQKFLELLSKSDYKSANPDATAEPVKAGASSTGSSQAGV